MDKLRYVCCNKEVPVVAPVRGSIVTIKLTSSDDLTYGDLFVVVKNGEPLSAQYLRLGRYETVCVTTGNVLLNCRAAQVVVLEHIPPAPWPQRLRRRERCLRTILCSFILEPGQALSIEELWELNYKHMPMFRPGAAFRAALAELARGKLISSTTAKAEGYLNRHWEDGYRTTGAGLLQAARWRRRNP